MFVLPKLTANIPSGDKCRTQESDFIGSSETKTNEFSNRLHNSTAAQGGSLCQLTCKLVASPPLSGGVLSTSASTHF